MSNDNRNLDGFHWIGNEGPGDSEDTLPGSNGWRPVSSYDTYPQDPLGLAELQAEWEQARDAAPPNPWGLSDSDLETVGARADKTMELAHAQPDTYPSLDEWSQEGAQGFATQPARSEWQEPAYSQAEWLRAYEEQPDVAQAVPPTPLAQAPYNPDLTSSTPIQHDSPWGPEWDFMWG